MNLEREMRFERTKSDGYCAEIQKGEEGKGSQKLCLGEEGN